MLQPSISLLFFVTFAPSSLVFRFLVLEIVLNSYRVLFSFSFFLTHALFILSLFVFNVFFLNFRAF